MVRTPQAHVMATGSRSLERNAETGQKIQTTHRGPKPKSSCFRGVTFYKRTKRWEAHIWDSGKQIYLGASFIAHQAARAYDRAAIRFRGKGAQLNFHVNDYADEFDQMMAMSKYDLVRLLRAQSAGRGSVLPAYPQATENSDEDQTPKAPLPIQERNPSECQEEQREDWEAHNPHNNTTDDRHKDDHFQMINPYRRELSVSSREQVIKKQCRIILSCMYDINLALGTPFLPDIAAGEDPKGTRNVFSPQASTTG